MAGGLRFICLSFSFSVCSIYSAVDQNTAFLPLKLKPRAVSGCSLSEWERTTAVMGTAVGRPFSMSPVFCNEQFCYEFPKLLVRYRPDDLMADPPGVMCAHVLLKKGNMLYPLGAPDSDASIFLRPDPRLPLVEDQDSLALCLNRALLPQVPFNVTFVKSALSNKPAPEPDDPEVLRSTREYSRIQGTDPMSRQFAEVLINIGVEQVNSQKFLEAVKTFNLVMGKAGRSSSVLIGRGTALALGGNLREAILDYSKAIDMEPGLLEAWRRRGQARAASEDLEGAAEDFREAILTLRGKQDPTYFDLLMERAVVYIRLKDFWNAVRDLRALLTVKGDDASIIFSLGQSLLHIAEPGEALREFQKALQKQQYNKLVWLHVGLAYRDMGDVRNAKQAILNAIQLDPNYGQAYRMLALLHQSLGNMTAAIAAARTATSVEPTSVEAQYLLASCQHAVGSLADALRGYDRVLALAPSPEEQQMTFLAFYQREVASFWGGLMQSPPSRLSLGDHFSPEFLEKWALRAAPTQLFPGYVIQQAREALMHKDPAGPGRVGKAVAADRRRLLDAADALGKRTHTPGAGSLPNRRLQRAAGMVAIDIMQGLQAAWGLRDGSSSDENEEGDVARVSQLASWRQLYDVAVHWLVLADPPTAAVWVDQLTSREFERGVGSVNVIVTGNTKNLHNRHYLPKAFSAVKEEMLDSGQVLLGGDQYGLQGSTILDLDPALGPQVEFAESPAEMWEVVGRDFRVLAPCHSVSRPGHLMNGTAFIFDKVRLSAIQFAVSTPTSHRRWQDFEIEMSAAFKDLQSALQEHRSNASKASEAQALDAVLRLSFFWYNFGPLAHGTAFAGHAVLLGASLAAGLEPTAKLPPGVQLDWEAVLSLSVEEFKRGVSPWLLPSVKPLSAKLRSLPDLRASFPDISSVIYALSAL